MQPNLDPKAAAGTNRVIAYVDGYNLYFGIREAELSKFLWLDIPEMVRKLLRPYQVLAATKYFTSRVSFPPESVKRQTTYLEALQTREGLTVHEGRYDGEPDYCKGCGTPYVAHSEKMTDVNIAIEMVRDTYADKFDTAILVTGDSDQVPTVRLVHDLSAKKKRVVCAFPPVRKSKHLRQVAIGCVNINEAILRASQLPEIITKTGGVLLARPTKWT